MALHINIPPVTRILLIFLVASSFLYNVARWTQLDSQKYGRSQPILVPYLTLVPAMSLYYPWVFLTATFVEQNIFTLIINGATIFYGGKYLERAWGAKEFGKVLLIISLIPNLLIAIIYIFWAALSGNHERALTPISGATTLQISFLVAFKQLVPEHTVTILRGLIKTRVKHFPALFLLLNTLAGPILGTDTTACLSWLGFLTSWTYLRFYKRQPDISSTNTGGSGSLKGDASETFAFAYFFPDIIQPLIAFISDTIYNALVTLRICTPFSAEDVASGNEQAVARGEAGLPSLLNGAAGGRSARGMGKREEAERRRALALKALDQRLHAATAGKTQTQQPVAPTVAPGQSMLGETSYNPDIDDRGGDQV